MNCQICGRYECDAACPNAKPTRVYTRAEVEALMASAWNLGHLNAGQSDEAYPVKVQRPIDIDQILGAA